MTQEEKSKIEIPFGAKDSELCGWEYTIPEGMEAEIVDGKVIVRKKESEDERIRKRLIELLKLSLKGAEEQDAAGCSREKDIEALKWGITMLETQKEQKPEQASWSWPNLSNCKHNCRDCMAKCFYRKEPYQWKPTEKQLEELHKYTPDNRVLTELYGGLQTL